MTRAFITEDDLLCREILCDLLEDHYPDIQVIGMADTVQETLQFLRNNPVDLLFLDIELPDGKGTEILDVSKNADFLVIITTSYHEYIEEDLPEKVLHAIIKPLNSIDLNVAMAKFYNKQQINNHV